MRRIVFILGIVLSYSAIGQQTYDRTILLMGSRFDITVVAENADLGNAYIDLAIAEIQRIENLISSWDPNSQTSEINKWAGLEAVEVDQELFELIKRSVQISKLTEGAFDISYASMDRIWKFDGSVTTMPDPEMIKKAIAKIGYEKIVLDEGASTVYLKEKGMKIGFGAIGKGYAADKAKALLQSKGVLAGIINASGDLNTWGHQPDGSPWTVAITNPLNKSKAFAALPITDRAMVTSGDYEKYVMLDGERYAHIIDPRTGYPSKNIVSVSVLAPSAEIADALATSIFVMGVDVGLHMIDQLPNIDCLIVDTENKIITSNGINLENEN